MARDSIFWVNPCTYNVHLVSYLHRFFENFLLFVNSFYNNETQRHRKSLLEPRNPHKHCILS